MKQSKPTSTSQRGFTIIEVLIVLLIAGLILSLVFLAVPALQRNSRNRSRIHATQAMVAAVEEYRVSYGHYPVAADATQFDTNNPQVSGPYTVEFKSDNDPHSYVPPSDTIAIQYGHWCNKYGNGDNATDPIAGTNYHPDLYAIWTELEPHNGSNPRIQCLDNYDHSS